MPGKLSTGLNYPAEKANDGELVIFGVVLRGNTALSFSVERNEGKEAVVTVINGKIKVEIPEVTMTDDWGTMTMKATGTIEEK